MRQSTTPTWKLVAVSAGLVGMVWIVFGQTLGHQFVNFDDGTYVYRNPVVLRGVSIEGTKWAFTHPVAANWQPLTVLSHMLDCQFFGVQPGGHHFTNVALHSVAVLLLFLVFWWMTRALWPSAFVAAIFAIHPLHVESVAWISERKDVLSAVFFMLTLSAYVRYARRSNVFTYLLVLICFGLGLMSKSMLVTVPFVLFLLDYWPLDRFEKLSIGRLILEKVPLFIFSAAACIETLVTQRGSMNIMTTVPLAARIGNAFLTLPIYLWQTLWPRKLAVFYPHPEHSISWPAVVCAVILFFLITAAAFAFRKRAPYLLVGWLWFVGMLVPVLGIVQVGIQAHADRYVYVPQIGLTLALVWIVANLSTRWPHRTIVLSALGLAILAPALLTARMQTSYWHDSQSLWERAVAVTPDNETARVHLSDAYLQAGRIDDALNQARHAVDANPDSAESYGVLGAALARKGELDEAIQQLRRAAELDSNLPRIYYNLGNVFLQRGQIDDAIGSYEKELRAEDLPEAHNNLALALLRKRQTDAAIAELGAALSLKPDYSDARNNLAIALSQKGEMREAIREWQKTLELQPDNLQAQCNLVWIYSTFPDDSLRDGSKAVALGERAIRLSGGKNPRIWRLVAAAYAEAGRFPEAIRAVKSGLALAEEERNFPLIQTLEENLKLLEEGQPLRDLNAAGNSVAR